MQLHVIVILIFIGKMSKKKMSSNRNIFAIIIHPECATFQHFVNGDESTLKDRYSESCTLYQAQSSKKKMQKIIDFAKKRTVISKTP